MTWLDKDFHSIQTPFDIENILRADKKLLAQWKKKPFYFDLDNNENIVVKYVTFPDIDMTEEK